MLLQGSQDEVSVVVTDSLTPIWHHAICNDHDGVGQSRCTSEILKHKMTYLW